MTTRRHSIFALIPLLLSACAGGPTQVQQQGPGSPGATNRCTSAIPVDRGRIWIYRTAPKGLGLPPEIVVDDRRYDDLLPHIGYTIDVLPGPHVVKLAYHDDKLNVVLQAGQEVFVRFDLDPAIFGKGFHPLLVERNKAQSELAKDAGVDFNCVR